MERASRASRRVRSLMRMKYFFSASWRMRRTKRRRTPPSSSGPMSCAAAEPCEKRLARLPCRNPFFNRRNHPSSCGVRRVRDGRHKPADKPRHGGGTWTTAGSDSTTTRPKERCAALLWEGATGQSPVPSAAPTAPPVMLTPITTARLNDVDPKAWLADVPARTADLPASRPHELLPWEWKRLREADKPADQQAA